MKRGLYILVMVLAGLASLGISTYNPDVRQDYTIAGGSLILDLGQAEVNVVAWDKNTVRVVWSQHDVRAGLRGTFTATEKGLTLNDYNAPVRETSYSYYIEPWLPLIQLLPQYMYRSTIPEADYIIYVPRASSISVTRSETIRVFGCNVARVEGNDVSILHSKLAEESVVRGNEVVLRDCTGDTELVGQHIFFYKNTLRELSIRDYGAGSHMEVEINDTTAEVVRISAHASVQVGVRIRNSELGSFTLDSSHPDTFVQYR